jgi:uncharacterized Zn finger protein
MTPEEELAEDAVRMLAAPKVFERGRQYYREGRVLELVERGNQLHAEVRGSDPVPYHVTLTSQGGRVSRVECTCPFEWGSVCKHAVAALLASFLEPKRVAKQPSLEELLAPLDRDRLQAMLLELAERQPDLAEWIADRVRPSPAAPAGAASPSAPELPPADTAAVRKQVRAAFRAGGYGRDYDDGSPVTPADEVSLILQQARPYLDAGEGRGAVALLEAVASELMKEIDSLYDEEGETYAVLEKLGESLAEAILTADLSPQERHEWEQRIEAWQRQASDCGYDEALPIALYAVRQGWDYPPLRRVLQGEITEKGAWEGEPPYCADKLAEVRLKVLERQERWNEYLHLSEAEGRTERYVTMLVRRGRIPEAVDYGLHVLETREEFLALARALEAAGPAGEALRVAERGLAAAGAGSYPTGELARWTRDLAARLGEPERALQAALTVMRERPTLADYQAVSPLAGERWPEVREALLADLRRRQSNYPDEEINILLHEGLIEDAMAFVDASPRHELVERVVEAALPTHPDWVFQACAHQFDRIADAGKSQYYAEAVQWLEKARAALLSAGREVEWRAYLADVIERHSRKYSLRPRLERLR